MSIELPPNLPEDVTKWKQDHVRNFLQANDVHEAAIQVLIREGVSGPSFVKLTRGKLLKHPYGLKGGHALDIEDIVEELRKLKRPDPERPLKRKAIEDIDLEYREQVRKLPSPSEIASGKGKQKSNIVLLHHRPASAQGIPTALMHPVFGQFVDDCANLQPMAEDVHLLLELSTCLSESFADESVRAETFRILLATLFGNVTIKTTDVGLYRTDGALWHKGFLVMNLQARWEPGSSRDVYLQNVAYYAKYIVEEVNPSELGERQIQDSNTRFPCFLLNLDGTSLSFATAVYGEKVLADTHLATLQLATTPTLLIPQSRVITSLRKAVKALQMFYNNPPPIEPSQRRFPYFNSFKIPGEEKTVHFKYRKALDPLPYPLLFLGDVEDPEYAIKVVLIKFTQRYSMEAHKACADMGIAPKLLGYEELAGGWKAVVMEYLGAPFRQLAQIAGNVTIKRAIDEAVMKMHGAGFVHGDLRDLNILCGPRDDGGVRVVFVDWDWAGRAGDVKYPLTINPDIRRHHSAYADQPILPEHDLAMVNMAFRGRG